jgi:hypothetical protein
MTYERQPIDHSNAVDAFRNVNMTCRPNMQVAENPSEALVAGGVGDIQPGPLRQ